MSEIWIDELANNIYKKGYIYEYSIKCIEYESYLKYIIIASRKVCRIFNKHKELLIGSSTLRTAFKTINYENMEISTFIRHKCYVYGCGAALGEDRCLMYSNYDIEDAKKIMMFMYKFQSDILKYKVDLKKKHLDNQIYIEKFNKQSKSYICNE